MYFPNTFVWKNEQDRSEEHHTTDAVLLLSFLFAVVLQKVLTADYALAALQSLRHGFAVPPPLTQGRLWCGAEQLDKLEFGSPGSTICNNIEPFLNCR